MLNVRFSALFTVVCLVSGAVFAQVPAGTPVAPATQPANEIIATINGEGIGRQEFTNALIQLHGLRLFEQLLPRVLVEQACKQAGITITEEMVQAQYNKRVEALGAENPLIPANQREMALREVLSRRGISMFEYRLQLWVEVGLLSLAKGKYTATDEDIKNAFEIQYGERYQLRDLVIGNYADAAEIRRLIEQEKRPVDDVIRERNLRAGNLVISEKSPNIPQQIRSVAFQLKEKQLSASVMMPDNTFHMLYLEKIIPAQPGIKLEDVKEKVRQAVTEAHEFEIAGQIMQNLRRAARVDVRDPALARVMQELNRQQQAAAAAAATQPSAAPAAPNK